MAASSSPIPATLNLKLPDLESLPPSAAEKISFASALARPLLKPRFDEIPLPARQYGVLDGRPSVPFSMTEFHAGSDCFNFTLIAKFSMGRPPIATVREVLKTNWPIKGRATVSDIWDGRHLFIILDSEEDVVAALTCPVRKIQNSNFRLFRYTSDYNPRKESTITTKWIRLPSLPPPLWHKSYIGAIVNSFAFFLDVDERTKACSSMRYARACAEIDVTKSIPDSVWIALPDGKGFWQNIEIEGNISYCSHCKTHGHELAACRKRKTSRMASDQDKVTAAHSDKEKVAALSDKEKAAFITKSQMITSANGNHGKEWCEVRRRKQIHMTKEMELSEDIRDKVETKDKSNFRDKDLKENCSPNSEENSAMVNAEGNQPNSDDGTGDSVGKLAVIALLEPAKDDIQNMKVQNSLVEAEKIQQASLADSFQIKSILKKPRSVRQAKRKGDLGQDTSRFFDGNKGNNVSFSISPLEKSEGTGSTKVSDSRSSTSQ